MIALPDRDWPAFNSWLDELFKAGPPTGPLTHRIEDGLHNFYAEDGTLVAQMGEAMYNDQAHFSEVSDSERRIK